MKKSGMTFELQTWKLIWWTNFTENTDQFRNGMTHLASEPKCVTTATEQDNQWTRHNIKVV